MNTDAADQTAPGVLLEGGGSTDAAARVLLAHVEGEQMIYHEMMKMVGIMQARNGRPPAFEIEFPLPAKGS